MHEITVYPKGGSFKGVKNVKLSTHNARRTTTDEDKLHYVTWVTRIAEKGNYLKFRYQSF